MNIIVPNTIIIDSIIKYRWQRKEVSFYSGLTLESG